ncbi:cytochrome d ubiquinol oxidase subunit II [Heyndrickxia ginsengihumi]|uniref:Cytochrome d ubiquinol oxidase subunit II n=1 Tax=Heyndrickxia ginsengihumi TaxID=363870 RepID=A0A6M0P8I3_9BACI|nr:cytochrome d ubiquinol oxidase subunit II [Heyndrickxia ginsengihumi]MBE6183136.1 cytochrome d ubiquinol oxidase subunit II [Bacillus sp. (in: firmicutes)]MCM3024239.1 cytochrome d ubiquinol oxidase subunit II [Heyndrickxia ginsengihumi]NEY20595.1 cytochrome d ubiquinol oxidase subunit II [Heyndrickxia ginsengihumi]
MSLNELWFLLISVLFVGFFFLEGYDYGVGMATRFLAKNEVERRVLINTIGPFWDSNEVWMITAGGAMFAAFPNWYATLFSGFYVPLVLMLLLLIARGTAFEFRGKVGNSNWRNTWDWLIFLASLLVPLLWGVVFSAIVHGLPIDHNMNMDAAFSSYLNMYTILGGLAITLLCFFHGLVFICLRTVGDLQRRARQMAKKVIGILAIFLIAFVIATYFSTDLFSVRGGLLVPIYALVVIFLALSGYFLAKKRDGWAFGMNAAVIALTIASLFVGLFPRVMISNIKSAYDLTIYNAASGSYSLTVMSIVAVTLLPFVLGYTIWSYIVFRKRVHKDQHLEY